MGTLGVQTAEARTYNFQYGIVDYSNDYDYNSNYNTNYQVNYTNNSAPIIYSVSPDYTVTGRGALTVSIKGDGFTDADVARFNNSDRPTTYFNSSSLSMRLSNSDTSRTGTYFITVYDQNTGKISNTALFHIGNGYVSSGTTNDTANTSNTSANDNAANSDNSGESASDLAGNALFGANGFLPTNIIQWIIVAILIFFMIILFRKAYRNENDKHAPLKHA